MKTPLAALNIYNGLLQDEAQELPEIREFALLSEQELDRIETPELAENHEAGRRLHRAGKGAGKCGGDDEGCGAAFRVPRQTGAEGAHFVRLFCDREWLMEAVDNIVKNALDHTEKGDFIRIGWKQSATAIQISVRDSGSGIHPEDLHHIFKRFYRSRYSGDKQGIGLGLPLAKAIIEAHDGTIGVDSKPGSGTVFVINFLLPQFLQNCSLPFILP